MKRENDPRLRLGIEFGGAVDLKIGHVGGPQGMLKKSIDILEEIKEFDISALDQNGDCNVPATGDRYKYKTACDNVEKVRSIVAMQGTPAACSQAKLEELYDFFGANNRVWENKKEAFICVTHWFGQYK